MVNDVSEIERGTTRVRGETREDRENPGRENDGVESKRGPRRLTRTNIRDE